ncbi:undecaprenyldiphospho-muramoylpentapeptide beta-N-acetylglucosaminyltransferase [candidate division KSB1 bacterium]
MKYILTGGGTGGHVYPALAIKEIIKEQDDKAEFTYAGISGKAEDYIINNLPEDDRIPFGCIKARGLPRSVNPIKLTYFLIDLLIGFRQSLKIIKSFQPDIIIATGGYVTAPVILAGRFKKKKIILHEQNSVPGLTNRFLSRFADKVLCTFPETVKLFKIGKAVAAGYPVRRKMSVQNKETAKKDLNVDPDNKLVFIFGGSSGAYILNEAVIRNAERLLSKGNITVIHGTGRDKPQGSKLFSDAKKLLDSLPTAPAENNLYILMDYIHNINTVYSACDLVVSRAGAGSIMECAAMGKPVILVPKKGLPGNHQELNAKAVSDCGGGIVIKEEMFNDQTILDGEKIIQNITKLINDPDSLKEMSNNIKNLYTKDTKGLIFNEIANILKQ